MKNSLKVTAMVAIIFFAASTVANSQQFRRPNNRMSYPGQCLEIPGLTDQQKTQITAINNEHQKTIDAMREQFYAADDLVLANEIKAKMTLEQNNHLKKISELLNQEQLIYFNENIIASTGGAGRAYNRPGRGGRGYGYNNAAPGRGRGRGAWGGRGRGAGYGRW